MTLRAKVVACAVLAVIVSVGVYVQHLRGLIAKRDLAIAHEIETVAIQAGGFRVALDAERDIAARLTGQNRDFLRRLREVDARVAVAAHIKSKIRVEDVVVLGPDEHRFVLAPDMKSLTRRQVFRLDVLILQGVNSENRVGHLTLEEIDPETGQALVPPSGFVVETNVQFAKDLPPAVAIVHPRVVAGFESHGYPILGVEVLNLERVGGLWQHANLSVYGVYNTKENTISGGALLGWRPFNWNLSVGPAYFFPSGGFGAALAVELTR